MTTHPDAIVAGARAMYEAYFDGTWDGIPEWQQKQWIGAFADGLAGMWQPIETWGVTHAAIWNGVLVRPDCWFRDGYWQYYEGGDAVRSGRWYAVPNPTHWMPLPASPRETEA